jgi:hypothetical protein
MISAVFLIFFLDTGVIYVHSEQTIFKTLDECNQFAEAEKQRQQDLVATGQNAPHKAIHRCIEWGQDV